ncbi:MAG TPA: Gar1/Naf1 family protein [Nitrosopumilaceae archaeon]|nr:Gar1/Naf1 family protein [Nitrosopumilaceae archaeon]
MHLASSGRVIIRLSTTVRDGQLLVDNAGRKIAKVSEMIGPIDAPYASATPLTNNIEKYVGKKIFMGEETPAQRPKRFRGRKR